MKKELEKVENLYSDNIRKHGVSSKSVGWNTKKCQNLRFEILLSKISKNDSFTMNDLGCGYGALIDYMTEFNFICSNYTGIDISEKMISKALALHSKNDHISFLQSDHISEIADYSVASGIFNVRFESSKEKWEKHILDTLTNLNTYSKIGFSFNLLTSYVDYKEPHLYYGDPCFFFDYCKKNFSKKVTLIHDYPLWEWTITVLKDASNSV
ncbi:SAM-dependent methyltransferase [Candidatus Marinamargulisbacteria bacterium SCGC AG-333-B06]|nr:SAM-dependent methyltransferase [Candidatus Marinamargulisbacteria bacterium SCGC AG-333-B06]